MKLLKTLTVASLLALAALSAHAQTQTYSWSANGGAWDPLLQTDFVSNVGGTLYSDQTLASKSNAASLNVAGATSGGLYTEDYYTFFSKPTFTLTVTDLLPGTNKIEFSIISSISDTDFAVEDLNINFADYAISFEHKEVFAYETDTPGGPVDVYRRVWSWGVEDLNPTTPIVFTWNFGNAVHVGIDEVMVVQSIPEPSTYALLGAGLIFSAIAYRRRRMATAA